MRYDLFWLIFGAFFMGYDLKSLFITGDSQYIVGMAIMGATVVIWTNSILRRVR